MRSFTGDQEHCRATHTVVWVGSYRTEVTIECEGWHRLESILRECSRTTSCSVALATQQQHRGPSCKVHLSNFRSEQTASLLQKLDFSPCAVRLLRLDGLVRWLGK